jgi:tetratricopeptide (TPR) repeat protein
VGLMINRELARMIARCSLRCASCGLSLTLVAEPLYAAGFTHRGALTQSVQQSGAPKSETQQLQPGKTAERELAGGQADYYQITLVSGEYLHVAVSQRGIDVVISLWGPDGKRLAEADDPYGGRGVERLLIVAEAPGIYQLVVRAVESDALVGRYDARIEELRPAAAQDVHRALAARLFEEGEKLRVAARLESRRGAIEKYQEAMTHWEAAGDRAGQANTLANIGWVYRDLGEMEKPLEYYNRALALFREASERDGEANVELVVLSACQTGLGKEIRGEGLVGLTRGFMYAGAPRVVASLWKVGDLGTAQLMSFFYRGMLKEGLRPAAALRAAQVAMWKQKRWQAPYNWAAFVLQGEWK